MAAATAALVGAVLQRKSGRESALAAARSAKAAEDSVALNAESATSAGRRSDAEALSKRYQEAVQLLGNDKAAVRLGGVYGLARLADDWEDQRQVCVNVFCSYLRMPLGPEVGEESVREREVRSSIAAVLRSRFRQDAKPSWSSMLLDFSHTTVHDLDLSHCHFETAPLFTRSRLHGHVSLDHCTFAHGANLDQLCVNKDAMLSLSPVKCLADEFSAFGIHVLGKLRVSTGFIAPEAHIVLALAGVTGDFNLHMMRSDESQGTIDAGRLRVGEGGTVLVSGGDLAAETLRDHFPRIAMWELMPSPGAEVNLDGGLVDAGFLSWSVGQGGEDRGEVVVQQRHKWLTTEPKFSLKPEPEE